MPYKANFDSTQNNRSRNRSNRSSRNRVFSDNKNMLAVRQEFESEQNMHQKPNMLSTLFHNPALNLQPVKPKSQNKPKTKTTINRLRGLFKRGGRLLKTKKYKK